VSSSKEIVCCQLQTPCFSENKNTNTHTKYPKVLSLARYLCKVFKFLQLTPHFKIALCAIFLRTQPKKMPYHSQILARKPAKDPRNCPGQGDWSIPNDIPKHIPNEWVKQFTMFLGWHVSLG